MGVGERGGGEGVGVPEGGANDDARKEKTRNLKP
jgi:hypothetical protein